MLDHLLTLAAGRTPMIDAPALEPVKTFINDWSPPQFSLPLFVLVFILALMLYKQWTKPVFALSFLILFAVVYFGAMFVDYNYYQILSKADNVPISMMLFGVGFFLWWSFRQAAQNDALLEAGRPLVEQDRDDKVLVWPDLVYIELICIVLASVVLVVWAGLLAAPLEAPANPAGPPNPSKAPWYFLGLQEMLVYFDPWMAGVLLPGLIVTGLIAMPYIDTNPLGNGYYTLRQRPFAIAVWLFGFIILWVVLIVFGVFLRGPNWNFFGPFAYWDPHLQVPLTNVNLAQYFWIWLLEKPEPTRDTVVPALRPIYMLVRESVGIVFILGWMLILPPLLARTVMRRMYQRMGAIRFYIMAAHLVVMGLLPLKMVLRWTCNLKYFIYLPEFNLNL